MAERNFFTGICLSDISCRMIFTHILDIPSVTLVGTTTHRSVKISDSQLASNFDLKLFFSGHGIT